MFVFKVLVLIVLFIVSSNSASVQDDPTASTRGIDTKSILESLTQNVMSRGFTGTASGGSQVVSLNLTNLLVLVLLKALIFAAGSLGAGHYKGGYGRSTQDEDSIFTEEELLLYLSYLTGDYGCLQNLACQQPQEVQRYVAAGEMLLNVSKMFQVDAGGKYQYILQQVQEAINSGNSDRQCEKFICNRKNET